MTPSKLNELAAVKVMGWRATEGAWVKWYSSDDGRKTHSPDWNPATDIADAWRLVEKMRADGWLFYIGEAQGAPVSAEFWKESGIGLLTATGHSYNDERFPDAQLITLAALRAVGVEESELNSKDND